MEDLIFFWGAYAYFPFVAAALWAMRSVGRTKRVALAIAVAGASVLAYARFVEPRLLTVEHATIDLGGAQAGGPSIRIALVSDTHYGVYRHATPMARIVRAVNREDVDAVLIAGDFTYHIRADRLERALGAIRDVEAPVYAVLGNHDIGLPGPDLGTPLIRALDDLGVTLVENRAFDLELGEGRVVLSGASDLWGRGQDFRFSATLPDGVPVLLLTHNPDTALNAPDAFAYDLMLAGHTHGGQVRIPWLYQRAIPTRGPFDNGLHVFPSGAGDRLVYVTPGTGMVGVPMRFLMPPRIDILTINLPR